MLIEKYTSIPLDHDVQFVRGERGYIVAASELGLVSVIGPPGSVAAKFKAANKLTSVDIHPSKDVIAIVCDTTDDLDFDFWNPRKPAGKVQFFNFNGTLLGSFEPENKPLASIFSFDGSSILLISQDTVEEVSIELYKFDWDSVKLRDRIASSNVEDPFVESQCWLSGIKAANVISMTLGAGGVPGSQGYWLHVNDGSLRIDRESALTEVWGEPVFSHSGTSFLVGDAEQRLVRFSYPEVHEVGSCGGIDEDELDSMCCFLDDSRVLVRTEAGRIFRISTEDMTLLDEFEISGHESKSTFIFALTRLQDTVVLRYHTVRLSSDKCTLLCVPYTSFL